MAPFPPEARRLAVAAAAGLALVAAVLLASAAIRHGADQLGAGAISALRGLHRGSASLEVVAMLAAGWAAWRLRGADPSLALAAGLVAGLTAFLSILGIAAGQNPPPAAAAGNLLGGLALAAAFAWTLGRSARRGAARLPSTGMLLGLVALQCALGAWLSVFSVRLEWSLPLFAHAALGALLAALAARLALRLDAPAPRFTLLGAALAAPAAGFASALFGQPLAAVLAHGAAAALLAATAAWLHGRFA